MAPRDARAAPLDGTTSTSDTRSPGESSRDARSHGPDTLSTNKRRFRALRPRFESLYGLGERELDDPERLEEWTNKLSTEVEHLDKRLQSHRSVERVLQTRADWSTRQLQNDSLPDEAKEPLRREAVRLRAERRLSTARRTGLEELRERLKRHRTLLASRRTRLLERAEPSNPQPEQVQKAQRTEQEARAELQQMAARRERIRDRQIRKLVDRRREYLSKITDLAGERAELIPQLKRDHHARVEDFTQTRDRLRSKLETRLEASETDRDQEAIDRLFERFVERRREARSDYREAREEVETAEGRVQRRRRARRQAEETLEETKARFRRLGTSELGEHRIELARTKLKYHRLRLGEATDVLEAKSKALEFHDERIAFYTGGVERLLPHVGETVRDRFYSVWRNDNWESARAGLFEAMRRLRDRAETRLEQFRSLPDRLDSVRLWGWLVGWAWRLLLIPVALYLVRHYGRWAVRRGMDALLHRPFFRRHAGGVIKTGELLRTLVWPVALCAVIHYNLLYVGQTFPEARSLDLLLQAGFLYWIGMGVVKLFVLPRAFREREEARAPAPDLGRLSDQTGPESHADDVVDLIGLEAETGHKVVGTVRHVFVFGLLAWVLPRLIADTLGHSLIWWLADRAFTWGTVLIAYVELSSWRDEIADGFAYFADDRMPRSVEFVQTHKDRIYGVLLVALVTVYLIVAEIVVLGRRYLMETRWSKRAKNVLQRKMFELQQPDTDASDREPLPEVYRSHFEERPLFDEPYWVERTELLESVREKVRAWHDGGRSGTLALYGEAGIGKTTMLNQLYREWQRDLEPSVCYTHLVDKVTDLPSVRRLLAHLFDLREVPTDREDVVERLLECEPRIVMIDDCHHMFYRKIGGFRALAFFFNVVNLTDHQHYWLLTSNAFGWRYLQRVQEHKHFFGKSRRIEPWSVDEIRALIQRRNEQTPHKISFENLVVTHEENRDDYYEVVQTANGYFRLLREFCRGNPRIALDFWLRNVEPREDGTLQVKLFDKPSTDAIAELSDDHLFALTALAQHGALTAGEVAEIINAERGFCKMALNYFEELSVAERVPGTRRYRLTTYYFRPVIDRLTKLNFLWA
jgi:GTPase SAR1 family protein